MRSEELDTLFTNIADSIRTAEDSAEPINVADFPTRIASLSNGGIPLGFIGIWFGSADNIPDGWALCDGTNGTPDLRDRFVLGAGTGVEHSVGDTGGSEEVTLTISQLPSHSHSERLTKETDSASYNAIYNGSNNISGYFIKTDSLTVGKGNLMSTAVVGGSQPHNNMPPYYTLCYIMKL